MAQWSLQLACVHQVAKHPAGAACRMICVTRCLQGSCCSHDGAVVAPFSRSGGSHDVAALGTPLQLSLQVKLALLLGVRTLSLQH